MLSRLLSCVKCQRPKVSIVTSKSNTGLGLAIMLAGATQTSQAPHGDPLPSTSTPVTSQVAVNIPGVAVQEI